MKQNSVAFVCFTGVCSDSYLIINLNFDGIYVKSRRCSESIIIRHHHQQQQQADLNKHETLLGRSRQNKKEKLTMR